VHAQPETSKKEEPVSRGGSNTGKGPRCTIEIRRNRGRKENVEISTKRNTAAAPCGKEGKRRFK